MSEQHTLAFEQEDPGLDSRPFRIHVGFLPLSKDLVT